ncbi:MAG: signal peptidase I [Pontixanthobacter sp.]
MSDEAKPAVDTIHTAPAHGQDNFFLFMLKLAFIVLAFRSFVFSPFNIPSESMLPTLANGDYLLAAKWPYGFSRYSLPGDIPLIPGRLFASEPERGEVVIFKHPVDGVDYIKRAIGLPGDTVAMEDGVLILNGERVEQMRLPDFEIAVSVNTRCHPYAVTRAMEDGARICAYRRYRETLPGGARYDIIDLIASGADSFAPITVPEGAMFVMGDNRDNSQDSRFDAMPGGGVGLVPQDLLVGRASIIMWSTDGSSDWLLPWTWFTALRTDRLGTTL